jgi:membrane protease YdiL (CAAX protease family)
VRGFVRRHQLVIFFVLSFAIGWCALPWGTFIAFSPLISVLLVVSVAEGRSGLLRLGRRVIKWRVRGIFYAAAIVLPLVVHAITIGLNMAAGAPAPSFAQFQPWYSVLLVFGLRMVNPTDGPLGEEPGWRGFAQPQLQRRLSPLAATAVLSLVIATWHLPLAFMPQFDLAFPDIATTVVVTFWYAWLFNRTGGSVLLTLIAHVTESCVNTQALWAAGPDADRMSWTWLTAWSVVVVALIVFDRRAWRRPVPTD